MKVPYWAALCVAAKLLGSFAQANPVDLSAPTDGVGASDLHGYLELWYNVDGVGLQLDKDSYLPLRFKVSSEPTLNGVLGSGFYMPMIEARSTLIRERMMKAYLPCGKSLFLRRDSVDPNKFQTVDQVWSAHLKTEPGGDDLAVSRNDGWTILYHQGRLASITTDENHVFTWLYEGGHCVGVTEDNRSMLGFEYDTTGLLKAITFDGKTYQPDYGERPELEALAGQTVIKQLVPALSALKFPDGKEDTFKFALTPNRTPTLTVGVSGQAQPTTYAWDPTTNLIATEEGPAGSWRYTVGSVSGPFQLPSISRTNSQNRTEGQAIDTKLGSYTEQALDGTTTIYHVFESPGPLYNKVRSIQKASNGTFTTVYQAAYDETGRIIRQVDEKGHVTSFGYDANGNQIVEHVELSHDPALLASLAAEEKVLVEKVKQSNASYYPLQDLFEFYIGNLQFDKAAGLLPLATIREQVYDMKLDVVVTNPNLSLADKTQKLALLIKEFPDKKVVTENFMTNQENK